MNKKYLQSVFFILIAAGIGLWGMWTTSKQMYLYAQEASESATILSPTVVPTMTPDPTQVATPSATIAPSATAIPEPTVQPTTNVTQIPTTVPEVKSESTQSVSISAEEEDVIFTQNSKHDCKFTKDTVTTSPGQLVELELKAKPSKDSLNATLAWGDMPQGVTFGPVDQSTISGEKKIPLFLSVSSNPQIGSFNIIFTYNESQEDGTVNKNFCQLNLIIQESVQGN